MIPGGDFVFKVKGIEIEGDDDIGVDVQYPWEEQARRFHEHAIHIASFYIDKYPVTNAQFKSFLDATHYHPADDQHFLFDWKDGIYPTAGPTSQLHGSRSKMRAPMRNGRASACRKSGNGNSPRKEQIIVSIRGATAGTRSPLRCPTRAEPCVRPTTYQRIRQATARSASATWSATCGNGHPSSLTNTRVRQSCAEEVPTSLKGRSGISRRPTATTSMESIF